MKDLPYFKFFVSEWVNGNITLCSYDAQGLFINICALYWSQSGCVRYADAKRRHSERTATAWKELISSRIIKIENDMIIINFLDEQFAERKELSNKNRDNALKKHKKYATAQRPHSDGTAMAYNIEERREEKKREEEIIPFVSIDSYKTAAEAFEEIKNDDIQMEKLLQIVHRMGFRSCDNTTLTLAIRQFLTVEGAKPDFSDRPRDDVKQHLVNWVNKNAKTIDQYGK